MLKIIISVIKWSIKILLLLTLLFCSIFILGQTRYARDRMIGFVNFILKIKYDTNIMASGVTGTIPYDIKVDHLTFSDNSGNWLDIQKVVFRFSPIQIFKGRLLIEEFKADSLELSRLPQIKKSDKPAGPFSLPSIIYHIGLKNLVIARLTLGKDILGKQADFILHAGMTEKEIGVKSQIFFDLKRIDGVAGSAFLNAELKGPEPYLNLDARIEEPENGLIGAVLGINRPLFISFNGSGPIRDWKGTLSINADQLVATDAQVDINSLNDDTRVNIEGTAQLDTAAIPLRLDELLNPQIKFRIPVLIKSKKKLALEHAIIESKNFLLDITTDLDVNDMTSEGVFTFNLNDIIPLVRSISTASSGALEIEGSFKGPISTPIVGMNLKLHNLKSDFIRMEEFNANARVEFSSVKGVSPTSIHLSGKGDIIMPVIPSLSGDPMEKKLTWDLDATRNNSGDIQIDNLQLSGDLLSLKISGIFNEKQNKGAVEVLLKADSLDKYSRFLKKEIPPGLGMSARIDTQISGYLLNARINGTIVRQENKDDSIINIIGPDIEFSGDLALYDHTSIKFSNFKINSSNFELSGSGLYDFNKNEIHSLLGIDARNLSAFSSLIHQDIKGSARVDTAIDGIIDMLHIKADLKSNEIVFNNARPQDLSIAIELSRQSQKNEGHVNLAFKDLGHTFKAYAGFKLDNEILSFNAISFDGPGFNLKGDLSFDTQKKLTQGRLDSESTDLSILAAIFNKKVNGAARFHIVSAPSMGKNIIDMDIHANDLSFGIGETDKLDIKLKLSGELSDPELTVSASILGFTNQNVTLKSMDLNALGTLQDLDFSITGIGQAGNDLKIETSGNLSLTSIAQSLRLNKFSATYGAIPVSLKKPFKITRSKESIALETMGLYLASGTIEGSGNLSTDTLDLKLDFNNIPVSMFQLAGIPELGGDASGAVMLSGDLKQPAVKTQLTLNNLGVKDAKDTRMPSFKLTANALLKDGRMEADLLLNSSTGNPFTLKMHIPVNLSIYPYSFGLPEKEDINGHLSGEINLSDIALLAGIYDQKFKGKLGIDLGIKGTITSPEITGEAKIENGTYENNSLGVLIKDFKAGISAESNRFILNSITGTDGAEGKISGKGWFDFSPSKGFPYNLSLNLKNISIIRTNTTTVIVSGKPTISGTLRNHTLTGKLSVERGEYRIPERLPAEITDLEVLEINKSEDDQVLKQQTIEERSIMNLDITVSGAGKVYLTGRGLDSEWKGDISIKGTTFEPIMVGRLSVLRGSYNFLGRRFNLTDGRIDFDGKYPISPYLDVTGEASTSEITAIIKLTGDFKKPDITLSSDPSLPSDEILSQLLFGRDVSQISPFQAIELGNALNSMLGKEKYDILGKTKKILGVDQLDLKQEEGEEGDESTLSVGKYLRDDLYIEVEKGMGTESGKASVTWEVTPNITVDTEMRENSSTGVGINWKWDY